MDISLKEQVPRVFVRRNTLQHRQHITRFIRGFRVEERRREQRVHRHDFEEKGGNRADRVPNERSELLEVFTLARELEQRIVTQV